MKRKLKKTSVETLKKPPQEDKEPDEEDELGEDEELSSEDGDAGSAEDDSNDDGDREPAAKMAKLNKAELFKPPTNEELHQLKETENLFQSSLFRMQIAELLSEVTLKEKKKKVIDTYLHKLRDVLLNLKSGKEHDLSETKWLDKLKVRAPFARRSERVAVKFKFAAPKQVQVVGSYLLGTCIKPDVHADLAVQIPQDCLYGKDYLNQRYLRKRALYLMCVARHLKNSPLVGDLHFTHLHGNRMKPIIVVTPAAEHGKNFTVRLHTYAAPGVLKLNRFHPLKNNVRTRWFFDRDEVEKNEAGEPVEPATPHYNTAVSTDLTGSENSQLAFDMTAESQGLKEGICLLKVWLHQRQLDLGYGSFSGFILTMFVVYLVTQRKLNKLMSSYQVLRNTLLQLSEADWTEKGISIAKEDSTDQHRPALSDFSEAFDVVFVDSTGYSNLCADLHRAMFERVRHEAKLSIQFLETAGVAGFNMLFMTPVTFCHKFDQFFHISDLDNLQKSVEKLSAEASLLDHCGDYVSACLPHLLQLLNRAVGRRVHLMAVRPRTPHKWPVTESPPEYDGDRTLTVGLLLNRETAHSVIDRGPAADSSEAQDFRDFWSDKSELRRFQDGSICEAVVWPSKNVAERRMVMAKIIKHVLFNHADIPRNCVTFISNQLEPLLKLPRPPRKAQVSYNYGTGEEQHLSAMQSYDELCKHLRGLKDLPLTINTIQGSSAVFRYTEVFPPMPATFKSSGERDKYRLVPVPDNPCPVWTPTIHMLCMLEGSGKWPEDKDAVKRIKAAFHVKLARSLQKSHSLCCSVHPTHVDVLKNWFVFRVEVGYKHEISLLKMVTTPEGMLKMADTEESLELERHLVTVPKLTSTLHGVQQQYNSFSGAARLAKRWLSSHLLLDYHVPEIAVELLLTFCYLQPAPYTVPSTPQTGFLRFLTLLCKHDWQTAPLIVNWNNELSKEDITEIETKFSKERSTLPLMYIATPLDKVTSRWTRKHPTPQILQRVVLLARESLGVLEDQLDQTVLGVDYKQIFRPPLDAYDVLIHLKASQLSRHYQAVDTTDKVNVPVYRNSQDAEDADRLPVIDYDPVKLYLKELRDSFDDLALFFHDTYGGSLIAVLWKPQALLPHDFKVSHLNCRMVETTATGKDVHLVPNLDAVLQDFKILGEGLVKSVEVQTKR